MDILADIVGVGFIFIGVTFSIIGVIGILRFPDTYSRLHASGKTSTLGVLFIGLGTVFILPSAILKIIALSIFIIFSGPLGSHAIAAAVHRGTAVQNEDAIERGDLMDIKSSGVHNIEYIQRILEEADAAEKEENS